MSERHYMIQYKINGAKVEWADCEFSYDSEKELMYHIIRSNTQYDSVHEIRRK